MGLSSKKQTTKSNETATTTPNVPGEALNVINPYYSAVGQFAASNPQQYIAPANAGQQAAYSNALALQNDGSAYGQALSAAKGLLANNGSIAMNGNPSYGPQNQTPTADRAFSWLTQAAMPDQYSTADVAGIGNRAVATGQAGSLGPAAQAGYSTYDAPQLGNASQVNAPRLGQAGQVNLQGYDATQIGDISRYLNGNVERVNAASVLDNFDAYLNPATERLVNATLANYDDYAGRQQAQYAAQGAAAGAFGGSRYGIGEAQLRSDLARQRGLTQAELENTAFNNAAGLSMYDATNRQQADLFNAGAQNERDALAGQLGYQGALFNAGALNDAARYGADAYNQGQLFNTGAQNEFDLAQAGYDFGAQQFNAGSQNDFRLAQAGYDADAARFGAGAANTAELANAQAANQFGLSQFDANNQFSLANMGAQNDAYGQQYGIEAQNAQQNAAAQNNALSQFYGTQADMNQFNAGQANANNQFNAGQANDLAKFNASQELAQRQQQMQTAALIADIQAQRDAGQINDAQAQAQIAQMMWQIQQQQASAVPNQLATVGSLLNPGGTLNTITGQTINSQGTNVSKSSGGLLGDILGAAASLGSAAIAKSERRVKRDIELLGRDDDGLGVYRYNYIWDDNDEMPRIGVMVDEVETLRPWALGPVVDGIRTVNYGAL